MEPVADFLQRRLPAQCPGGVEDFADLIRAGLGFLEQIHPRLLDLHFFGADADDRMSDAHEQSPRRRRGPGHLLQFEPAVLILGDLFHRARESLNR